MKRRISNLSVKVVTGALLSVMAIPSGGYAYASASDVSQLKTATTGGNIHGTVRDSQGEPLIGATVAVKGTSTGTTTDIDGNFTLPNVGKGTLVVSYVGYTPAEIKIASGQTYDITLKESSELLNEVVVVGYGTQKKETLSGAVSAVSGDVLESRPVSNTAIGLQGQVPGLTITRTSARPGNEDLGIQIRGASSVNTVEPLIIIDGVPAISKTEFSSLNPDDIAGISVLKDASAAIYGSRAAGGVILVTTKKGKKNDKIKVSYNGMVTLNTPANQLPLAGMKEWANAYIDASYQDFVVADPTAPNGERCTQRSVNTQIWQNIMVDADGNQIVKPSVAGRDFTDYRRLIDVMAEGNEFDYVDVNGVLHHYASNNWLDHVYGNTVSTQHNLSVTGASEKARWFAAVGYAYDRSVIKAVYDGVRKYNARMNVDFDLKKWLTWNVNMSYSNNYMKGPRDGLDGNNSGMYDAPCSPAYTPDGHFYDFYMCGRSPLAAMKGAGIASREFATFRFSTALYFQIFKDLKITAQASLTKNDNIQKETKTRYTVGYWDTSLNRVNEINGGTSNYIQERSQRTLYEYYLAQADYNHYFGNHYVAAMIGVNAERNSYKNVTAKRAGILYEGLFDLNTASSEAAQQHISGGSNQNGFVSFFTRLNYQYDGRYLLELLGRRDGTSKFHKDYRWSNFGAASAAWRISQEKFITDNCNWLTDLKIRASYGVTGGAVSSLGNYDYLSTVNTTGTHYFDSGLAGTAYLGSMIDYSRTWEKLHNFNVGIDFGFLNNRLKGSFDWYQKVNKGMLTAITYPDILGGKAPATNNARLRVRGWEASLSWNDRIGEVSYWVGAQLTDARSKVTDYKGTDNWVAGFVSVREGYPLNSLFLYKTDGYFTSYEEIEEYYRQYANCTGGNALGKVPQNNEKTHLRPGDRRKVLILDPENDTTDGKGNTGSGDVYYYGDTDPHYQFSFNLGATWKGIDFSMFIQGVGKRNVLRGTNGSQATNVNKCAFYRNYNNILLSHLDTWTWDNQDARYARLSLENAKNDWNYNNNDSEVQNGWYARVKNITLGYTLPKKITDGWGISKLRFYLSGDNIGEVTGIHDGYDPEKSGRSNTSLPFARNWTFGIDLQF